MLEGIMEPRKVVSQLFDYIDKEGADALLDEAKKMDFIKQSDLLMLSMLFLSKLENNLLVKRDLRLRIKEAIKKNSVKIDLKDLDLLHIALRDALLRKKVNEKVIIFCLMWIEMY